MYQIYINHKPVGQPMLWDDAIAWRQVLRVQFPKARVEMLKASEVVEMKKAA